MNHWDDDPDSTRLDSTGADSTGADSTGADSAGADSAGVDGTRLGGTGQGAGRPGVGGPGDVLLVTGDDALARRVLELAGAADIYVHRIAEGADRRAPAPAAGMEVPEHRLILVGADVAVRLAEDPELPDLPVIVVAERQMAPDAWHAALVLDAEQVVLLPEAETWLVSRLLALRDVEPSRARVVGVIGGRGGAGASVLSAALARTAAGRGRRPMLVDADPLGGGSDILLGAEDEPGVRWPDLAAARGRLQGDVLFGGLPVIDGVHVVSGDRREPYPPPPEAMTAVLDAGRRTADLVVVDLPRALDPASGVALEMCDLALLVVPAEVRASISARRAAALLRRHVADVRLVVRGPSPTGLDAGQIARMLDLPLAGWLRPEKGLAAALDRGEPPGLRPRGPLATFCRRLLSDRSLSPHGFVAEAPAGETGVGRGRGSARRLAGDRRRRRS